MRSRSLSLTVFAVFSFVGSAFAQASLPVRIDLNHASFAYDDSSSLVEFYLAFAIAPDAFEATDQGFRARLPIALALYPGAGTEPVWQDENAINFVIADTAALSEGSFFVHQVRAQVTPGSYELHLEIPADEQTGRREFEMRYELSVPNLGGAEKAMLSDVTLATSIQPTEDRNDPFYKNGLSVRPSANHVFGNGVRRLFYYGEAYNTGAAAGPSGKYTARIYVSAANSKSPIQGMIKSFQREPRSPDVLVGSFDLDELGSGSYELHVAMLDENNREVATQTRKFFVYNPGVAPLAVDDAPITFDNSQYATMTEEEVELAIEQISIIATTAERRKARSIRDLDESRRFLMEFWEKRNPNPGSAVNTFRDEFYRRLQIASERYSEGMLEGWQTDRGRVLIKYGAPAAIEPHLFDQETTPHEIWQYENIPGAGQSIFVFADRRGYGQFELIHSNVPGERSLSGWQDELQR